MYKGAFRSSAAARHLENLEKRVLSAVTVLSYDVAAARVYGQVRAHLETAGRPLADADLQIAATALVHDLELVTGNVKHFKRVPGLRISPVLVGARGRPAAFSGAWSSRLSGLASAGSGPYSRI